MFQGPFRRSGWPVGAGHCHDRDQSVGGLAALGGKKPSDLSADQLLAVFLKLNIQDPNTNTETRDNLSFAMQLLKLQAEYEAAKKKCEAGNDAACAEAKKLAAKIAELEAQLAAS